MTFYALFAIVAGLAAAYYIYNKSARLIMFLFHQAYYAVSADRFADMYNFIEREGRDVSELFPNTIPLHKYDQAFRTYDLDIALADYRKKSISHGKFVVRYYWRGLRWVLAIGLFFFPVYFYFLGAYLIGLPALFCWRIYKELNANEHKALFLVHLPQQAFAYTYGKKALKTMVSREQSPRTKLRDSYLTAIEE